VPGQSITVFTDNQEKSFIRLDKADKSTTGKPQVFTACYGITCPEAMGSSAMFRALLIASVISLWCFAQFPEILLGTILPRSLIKDLSVRGSL
jgi:hypothetical protein